MVLFPPHIWSEFIAKDSNICLQLCRTYWATYPLLSGTLPCKFWLPWLPLPPISVSSTLLLNSQRLPGSLMILFPVLSLGNCLSGPTVLFQTLDIVWFSSCLWQDNSFSRHFFMGRRGSTYHYFVKWNIYMLVKAQSSKLNSNKLKINYGQKPFWANIPKQKWRYTLREFQSLPDL